MVSIDYTIYLVTGRKALPPGKDYFQSLEESLQGGVTLVLIREKETDTAEFIEVAAKSKEICDRYNVPILINDRVDVAIAIGAHGVHVGQTDMPVPLARQLMPKGTIIGLSCNTPDEVRGAIRDGADYISIGAIWPTQTKKMTTPYIGVRGVGEMMQVLDGTDIKAIAIGGVNAENLLHTLHGSVSPTDHPLDGVCMIAGIVSQPQPRLAVEKIAQIFKSFRASRAPSRQIPPPPPQEDAQHHLLNRVAKLVRISRDVNPLIHQITNEVAATNSANATLAVGGSPIMSKEHQEMEDLGNICSAVLVNTGALRSNDVESISIAGLSANSNKKPIIFDSAGVDLTAFRRETVHELLDKFQVSVIKGTARELAAIAKLKELSAKSDPARFVKALANKERCVIVMTGPVNYVSDGTSTVALKNGHHRLSKTADASGVMGSCIATYCGATYVKSDKEDDGKLVHGDTFLGAVAGILVFAVAAQLVEGKPDVGGPGSFLPALIDELNSLQPGTIQSLGRVEFYF